MNALFSFDTMNFEHDKKESGTFDLFSFNSATDVAAPHPDLFESDLDLSLAGLDQNSLPIPIIEQPDPFSFLRSDTPTCGPLSAITASSESASAYDGFSTRSESYYNYTPSSQYSYPIDMDFASAAISTYDTDNSHSPGTSSLEDFEALSFGTLATPNVGGRAYSDYASSDYYPSTPAHPSLNYGPTVAPSTIAQSRNDANGSAYSYTSTHQQMPPQAQQQATSSVPPAPASMESDARRRYQCAQCPRAFARAYNLKTHMATHDPNRLKPHVCPHRNCGRSFSRKHDLGRHLVSIHRDDPQVVGGSPSADEDSGRESSLDDVKVGVAGKEGRAWCDTCGKSYMRDRKACACAP